MVVKSKQVCELFGISKATLSGWRQAGAAGQLGRDKWDLGELVQWHLEVMTGQGSESTDESLQEARRQYWLAKARREHLKADQEAGQLVPRSELVAAWCGRVAEVTAGLQVLVDRLPPLLIGKDRGSMRETLAQEIRALRQSYSRPGKHCEVPASVQSAINRHYDGGQE